MTNRPDSRERFLTAEWRHLLMLNYAVEREVLEPLVPAGTTLDTYKGRAYVSLVAFQFLKTRVLGVPVPFHQDFEEVNLRFYVRRFSGEDWRRGVVFIKEIVPKPAVAFVARTVYNENYISLPMRSTVSTSPDGAVCDAEYSWKFDGRWTAVRASASGAMREAGPASLEEFITEHYWGYAAQPDGGCMEYAVEHPRWKVAPVAEARLTGDVAGLYAAPFAAALSQPPASAFLADGSAVTVFKGVKV